MDGSICSQRILILHGIFLAWEIYTLYTILNNEYILELGNKMLIIIL